MKWYPWLNGPYRQILACYQQERGHHALLLHSQSGNGEESLCYAISCWLMCRRQDGIKICGTCHSCRLMQAGNHPDYYHPEPEKGRQSLGVDSIRLIIDNVYNRAHQGGLKVVWLPRSELLTEQAANALLKTLEEPPEETYFLLGCQDPSRLLLTLRSRCLYWPLPAPEEALSLFWLQQTDNFDPLSACTALRLCSGAPLAAKALLQPRRWQERLALCAALSDAIISGNMLTLLPILNQEDDGPLCWMLSLLTDALKWQQGAGKFLANIDMQYLVESLAAFWSVSLLHTQWQQWLHCRRQWHEVSEINHELLLIHHLLNWEKGVADVGTTFSDM
ncbi:MAG: DNA polymerase III subunit delta' [Sodalis sp. Psp]|nr:DNA polymerase III subunit delta' [Sodalis sp. Psp]MCR3756551.1 DNA polymerase III subunit delta' [Sodalis sp. Ppy]